MFFLSWMLLYCCVCFVLGCWLYPITKFTMPTIEGHREKWELSLRIEWTTFGFCLYGFGLTVTQVRSYLVYKCNHRPQLQFMGLSYYNFRKDKYFFLQEFIWRPSSREDGEELWSLLSFLGDQTSGPFSLIEEYFNTNCNAGCGLLAPWRRGARVSEELGLLPHQVADDRDLEGSSDPEKVSQPCYFKELPRWEVGPWQFKRDLTLLSWWIC